MLPEIRALLILQDRDRRLLTIAKDLEKLPQDETRAKRRLTGDEAAMKQATDAVHDCELRMKRLELDAGTRKTTIQRLKTQQFETRKNEEFQALGHEVTRYEKELDELETRELELMEELDGLKDQQKKAQAAKAQTAVMVAEDLELLTKKKEQLLHAQAELKTERQRLVGDAPEALMPLYERLMKTKAGVAIAQLDEGKCGGCHMKLIASTVVAVQTGKVVTRCEDCGRILYVAD